MPEPIDGQDFAGPHPTCREFVDAAGRVGIHPARGRSRAHRLPRSPAAGRCA